MSSANHALILTSTGMPATDQGRTVIDFDASKLRTNWDAAGSVRYVKNASVWLLGLDHRIASDLPLRGKKKKRTPMQLNGYGNINMDPIGIIMINPLRRW